MKYLIVILIISLLMSITACTQTLTGDLSNLQLTGVAGSVGPQGPAGPAGANGANGANGAAGSPGIDGEDGQDGINGDNATWEIGKLTDYWCIPGWNTSTGSQSIASGMTVYYPIKVTKTSNYTGLGVYSGQWQNAYWVKARIYSNNSTSNLPSANITAQYTITATGTAAWYSTSCNVTLTPGVYWVGYSVITTMLFTGNQYGSCPAFTGVMNTSSTQGTSCIYQGTMSAPPNTPAPSGYIWGAYAIIKLYKHI